MKITIETDDNNLLKELVKEEKNIRKGFMFKIPGGLNAELKGFNKSRSNTSLSIIELVVTAGNAIGAGLAANWLYYKLNKKIRKIYMNKKEILLKKVKLKK